MTEYDDDREFTRYVWASSGYLLTPFERRVGLAADAAVKAAACATGCWPRTGPKSS